MSEPSRRQRSSVSGCREGDVMQEFEKDMNKSGSCGGRGQGLYWRGVRAVWYQRLTDYQVVTQHTDI